MVSKTPPPPSTPPSPRQRQPPDRATAWKLRSRRLELPARPLLMGIINVTPDSFSDGGLFLDPRAAVQQGRKLVDDGADLLDVGGESTRPYSETVAVAEELRRVASVVAELAQTTGVPISVDTSKAAVAHEALEAGAQIVNDVTALAGDPQMIKLISDSGCGVCAMHMQGTPQTMQDNPKYDDVVEDVLAYLRARRDVLLAAGVERERICLDPGIGFGKTTAHNVALLAGVARFHQLGCPLLIGHSRKGFIGKLLGDPKADRTAGSIGVALAMARHGVQILRLHDVATVRQALLLFESTGGLGH